MRRVLVSNDYLGDILSQTVFFKRLIIMYNKL